MKIYLCIKKLFVFFLVLMLIGCNPVVRMAVPTEHVVMFDREGKPLNPSGNFWFSDTRDPGLEAIEKYHTDFSYYSRESYDEFERHSERIINELMTFNQGKQIKKIMFFIHGGLNTQVESIERIVEDPESKYICNADSGSDCRPRFERIKDAGYFPIFVNWKSSLVSSYLENLFFLRQGDNNPYLAVPTSPFAFATDAGRSIFRWPLVAGSLILNDIKTLPYDSENTRFPGPIAKEVLCRYQYPYQDPNQIPENYNHQWTFEECLDEEAGLRFREAPWICPFTWNAAEGSNKSEPISSMPDTFSVEIGDDYRECPHLMSKFALYIPSLPFKLLTMPVVDAFGTSSWDVMLRRVDLLFHSEAELKNSNMTDKARRNRMLATMSNHGGLSLLLQKLVEHIEADGQEKWEITLVGHSMGTIVANQLIRNYGTNLPIKNIIYLAAAATVYDYENTIYPYLFQNNSRRMYHYMLHPRAEEEESMGAEFAARGSLLVWIDNFLSKPLSRMSKTVGRYDNLLPALHNADQSIRNQISLKVYSAGDDVKKTNPQTHSEVSSRFKFWEKDCWETHAKEECIFR